MLWLVLTLSSRFSDGDLESIVLLTINLSYMIFPRDLPIWTQATFRIEAKKFEYYKIEESSLISRIKIVLRIVIATIIATILDVNLI